MPTLRRTGATLLATAALVGGTGTVAAEAAAPANAAAREATAKAATTARMKAEMKALRRQTRELKRTKAQSRKARNKSIARPMVRARGWNSAQFACLTRLWNRESGWNHFARNPGSGAYGIPQALPAGKMASAGRDWRTNPRTQIKWGLKYIKARYGTPCAAWAHARSRGWY